MCGGGRPPAGAIIVLAGPLKRPGRGKGLRPTRRWRELMRTFGPSRAKTGTAPRPVPKVRIQHSDAVAGRRNTWIYLRYQHQVMCRGSRNQRASSSPRRISPTSAPAMHREALVTRRSTRLPAVMYRPLMIIFSWRGGGCRTDDLVLVSKMNRGRRDLMKRW